MNTQTIITAVYIGRVREVTHTETFDGPTQEADANTRYTELREEKPTFACRLKSITMERRQVLREEIPG
jgi:hypothetical protein